MKVITSKQNESVKKIVSLHTSKGRQEYQQFIAEGLRTLERFERAGHLPTELYMTENAYNQMNIYPGINPTFVTDDVMQKMSTLSTAPGVLAVFDYSTLIKTLSTVTKQTHGLVLADLQDPGNIGTLIRSAAAFDCDTVITIGGADPLAPKVIQASAGTIASMKLITCSWQELIDYQNRPALCALVVDQGTMQLEDLKQHHPMLVIGNEAHGLPTTWSQSCKTKFTIPMNAAAESLNAAIAGSIALFLLQK